MKITVCLSLVALFVAAPSQAALLANGGFEDDGLPNGDFASTISSWSIVAVGPFDVGNFNPASGLLPTEGDSVALMDGFANSPLSIWQTPVSAGSLSSSALYTLSFDFGNRGTGTNPENSTVRAFFTLGSDEEDFNQRVGGFFETTLSSITSATFLPTQTIVLDTSLLSPSQLAESLNVVFQLETTGSPSGSQLFIDDTRLVVQQIVIPEPATVAPIGLGGMLVLAIARKRRRCRERPHELNSDLCTSRWLISARDKAG